MPRKLFCEISPLTYRLSTRKEQAKRRLLDAAGQLRGMRFAAERETSPLPVLVFSHQSVIRRKLGNADPVLQENKAVNLALAAPQVNSILIRPGEAFSFWRLVGDCTEKRGYREGMVIRGGTPDRGIGGGMCQFTNLIHWMVLHSPLEIREHHHHDGVDLFPDAGRRVPFGTGTSILYNYRDYRFYNGTAQTFQLLVKVEDDLLCGELRTDAPLPCSYHVRAEGEYFAWEGGEVYRYGRVYRRVIDRRTGQQLRRELIKENRARVMYDPSLIAPERFRQSTDES